MCVIFTDIKIPMLPKEGLGRTVAAAAWKAQRADMENNPLLVTVPMRYWKKLLLEWLLFSSSGVKVQVLAFI